LLEVVLVMVIICTLLGAAAPSLRGFFVSRQTDDTATRILALTRLGRSRAVSEGCTYRLVLDNEGRIFFLSTARPQGFQQIQSSLGRPFSLPDGVDLKLHVSDAPADRDYVDFFPDGRTQPAEILLRDMKGGVVSITCRTPAELFIVETPEEEP
jgi:Tfp pilus assembly protein FimT